MVLWHSHLCTEQLIYIPAPSKQRESAEISAVRYTNLNDIVYFKIFFLSAHSDKFSTFLFFCCCYYEEHIHILDVFGVCMHFVVYSRFKSNIFRQMRVSQIDLTNRKVRSLTPQRPMSVLYIEQANRKVRSLTPQRPMSVLYFERANRRGVRFHTLRVWRLRTSLLMPLSQSFYWKVENNRFLWKMSVIDGIKNGSITN